jgi:hypothetical protein
VRKHWGASPDTAIAFPDFGEPALLGMLTKEQVAKKYLQRALVLQERVLGVEHKETRKTREGLASVAERLS